MENTNVPIEAKHCLTIEEAASYFNIGQHMIRSLAAIKNNNYSLKVGKKTLIKRELFGEYVNGRKEL